MYVLYVDRKKRPKNKINIFILFTFISFRWSFQPDALLFSTWCITLFNLMYYSFQPDALLFSTWCITDALLFSTWCITLFNQMYYSFQPDVLFSYVILGYYIPMNTSVHFYVKNYHKEQKPCNRDHSWAKQLYGVTNKKFIYSWWIVELRGWITPKNPLLFTWEKNVLNKK